MDYNNFNTIYNSQSIAEIPTTQNDPTPSTGIQLYDNITSNQPPMESETNDFFNYKNDSIRFENAFCSTEQEPGEILNHPEYVGIKLTMNNLESGSDFIERPMTPTGTPYNVPKKDPDYIYSEEYKNNCNKIENLQAALFSRTKFISEEINSLEKEALYYSAAIDLIEKTFPRFLKKTEDIQKEYKNYKDIDLNNKEVGRQVFNKYEIELKNVFKNNKDNYPDKEIATLAFNDEKHRAKQKNKKLFLSEQVMKSNKEKLKNCKDQLKKYTGYFNSYNAFYNNLKDLDIYNIDSKLQETINAIYSVDSNFKSDFNSFDKLKRPERKTPEKIISRNPFHRAIKSGKLHNRQHLNKFNQNSSFK